MNEEAEEEAAAAGRAIPLYRPDLTRRDETALLALLSSRREPEGTGELLRQWESGWERLWERSAVAFASTEELLSCLKQVMGWPSGTGMAVDPWLAPEWREAMAQVWLHAVYWQMDASGLLPIGLATPPPEVGELRAVWRHHAWGLVAPAWDTTGLTVMEEISAVLSPTPGVGEEALLLLSFEGNRILQAGGGALVLGRDESLMAELRRLRRYPPVAAACALGASQLAQLPFLLERRAAVAARLAAVRGGGYFRPLLSGREGRVWEQFILMFSSAVDRESLRDFLCRARIGAASPVWFHLPEGCRGGGVDHFLAHALQVPLYAALCEEEEKRMANRIKRWVKRRERGKCGVG